MENRKNSKNQSTNNTVIIYGDNTSPQLTGFSCIFSVWIIAVNALVVLYLIKNQRRLIKNTFAFQILILSVSDLFVGLSTLPIYVTGFTSQNGYEICLFGFVFLLSAQAVEQFQILGICVNRLSVVCQLTSPLRITQNKKVVVIYLLVNWVVFLFIFSAPFGILGKYRDTVSICSLNELLQDNYKIYVTYTLSVYILPSILITFLYLAILIKINCSSHQILGERNSLILNQMNITSGFGSRIKVLLTEKRTSSAEQAQVQENGTSNSSVTVSNEQKFDEVTTNDFREKINSLTHEAQESTMQNNKDQADELANIPTEPTERSGSNNSRNRTGIVCRQQTTSNARRRSSAFMSQRGAVTTIGMTICNIYVIHVRLNQRIRVETMIRNRFNRIPHSAQAKKRERSKIHCGSHQE